MRIIPLVTLALVSTTLGTMALDAHPMGNFSVSHYANLEILAHDVDIQYVLDLAELPTFELLREWKMDRNSARADLERKAAQQVREWARNLLFTSNGKLVRPVVEASDLVIADGAGNLPILRISCRLRLHVDAGSLDYEDRNYPDRAGWKEVIVRSGKGSRIGVASQGAEDRSKALTAYPADPTVAPPQDLRASVQWTAVGDITSGPQHPAGVTSAQKPPVLKPIPQPAGPPASAPATMTPQAAPPGAVVRGDFLSRLLHQRDLTFGMILIALVVAFGLGAAHALTPGHGKTIVAAYLVGSRGTLKHAAFLGAMVTFTHTVSVFLLGLATLFLFQYVMPEKITQVLGAISGLSIVAIGGWMVYKRIRALRQGHHHHGHDHEHHHHDHDHAHEHHHHDHDHAHAHDHAHDHDHAHTHDHHHTNDHGHAHGHHHHHHHVPELSWGGLIALGVSGGLVPCESALILLLSAIALGRVGLGLLLLVAFSLGLAIVLMGIGVLVIFAKHLIPERQTRGLPALRWVPVLSGAVVVCIGLIMTGVSLGWIGTKWMIG